jgi:hypothetical protein
MTEEAMTPKIHVLVELKRYAVYTLSYILVIALYENITEGQSKKLRTSCRSGVRWWM